MAPPVLPSPGCADALLFDLGRVVLELDTRRTMATWARHAGCEPDAIRARWTFDEAARQHETGEIDTTVYFNALRTLLAADLAHEQLLEGWNALFVGTMPGIPDLLARAAKRLPLYALSNTNPAHEVYFMDRFADTMAHFRAIYTSSTIGVMKPDMAAYDHVLDAIGISAQRIVFFDDLIANVDAARQRGLIAVHVNSPTAVAEALAAMEI